MSFQPAPIPLVGVTSKNRSHQANNELTKNWYPQISTGVAEAILLPWLGANAFGASGGNLDRGLHIWNDVLYHVVNQTLYSVDSSGAYTSIGTITGTQRCIFSNSIVGAIEEMVIAAGNIYTYDGTTLTDSGLDADSVTYLNSKSIYPNGGAEFAVSGAGGATDITSTGVAESSTDVLLRPYAFGQWCYMFGSKTIEPFYDNGSTTGVPLGRVDTAIMQKGLGGFYTIANTDQALYFLADDSNVYQIIQSQLKKISTPDIVNSIKDLNRETASAYSISFNGYEFYILWFPTGLTYAYCEDVDEWFNLSSGVDNEPYLASSYAQCYGLEIVSDYRTSNLATLGIDTYSELGEPIQRQRVLPPITSKNFGLPYGQRMLMSKIKFALQKGVGLASGQGSDPKIMVEYSLDGGDTWSTARWIEIGRMGDFLVTAEYFEMVSFYEITFRITISDPVFSSLHDATIYIKKSGY